MLSENTSQSGTPAPLEYPEDQPNAEREIAWLIQQRTCEFCGVVDADVRPHFCRRSVKKNGYASVHWRNWRICRRCYNLTLPREGFVYAPYQVRYINNVFDVLTGDHDVLRLEHAVDMAAGYGMGHEWMQEFAARFAAARIDQHNYNRFIVYTPPETDLPIILNHE